MKKNKKDKKEDFSLVAKNSSDLDVEALFKILTDKDKTLILSPNEKNGRFEVLIKPSINSKSCVKEYLDEEGFFSLGNIFNKEDFEKFKKILNSANFFPLEFEKFGRLFIAEDIVDYFVEKSLIPNISILGFFRVDNIFYLEIKIDLDN